MCTVFWPPLQARPHAGCLWVGYVKKLGLGTVYWRQGKGFIFSDSLPAAENWIPALLSPSQPLWQSPGEPDPTTCGTGLKPHPGMGGAAETDQARLGHGHADDPSGWAHYRIQTFLNASPGSFQSGTRKERPLCYLDTKLEGAEPASSHDFHLGEASQRQGSPNAGTRRQILMVFCFKSCPSLGVVLGMLQYLLGFQSVWPVLLSL